VRSARSHLTRTHVRCRLSPVGTHETQLTNRSTVNVRSHFLLVALLLAAPLAVSLVLVGLARARKKEEFATSSGDVRFSRTDHAALLLEAGGRTIDVHLASGNDNGLPKADPILLIRSLGDHFAPATIDRVREDSKKQAVAE
jgi:hypothetical protein